MILLVHMLFGVAVASLTKNPYLAILVAFLSHYFLDVFPHIEYPVDNLKKIHKNFKNARLELFYLILDILLGIFLVSVFTDKSLIIFICALLAVLPDGLTVLSAIIPNKILDLHDKFHRQTIHFLRDKKISNFVRIFTQIIAVIIAILILK